MHSLLICSRGYCTNNPQKNIYQFTQIGFFTRLLPTRSRMMAPNTARTAMEESTNPRFFGRRFAAAVILTLMFILAPGNLAGAHGLPVIPQAEGSPPPPIQARDQEATGSRPWTAPADVLTVPTATPADQLPVLPRDSTSPVEPGNTPGLPKPRIASPELTCKISQGFEAVPPVDWTTLNVSNPKGSTNWFLGDAGTFQAQSGPLNSYAGANFNNTGAHGTISNWLITPVTTFQNGDVVRFFTRTTTSSYPDRLQVRLSLAGSTPVLPSNAADTGSFTTLTLDINPTYAVGGYPLDWTEYTAVVPSRGSWP
jgi:hypothetical protein